MVSLDTENREYHDDAVNFITVKANSDQNISRQIKNSPKDTICSNISKCVWKLVVKLLKQGKIQYALPLQ